MRAEDKKILNEETIEWIFLLGKPKQRGCPLQMKHLITQTHTNKHTHAVTQQDGETPPPPPPFWPESIAEHCSVFHSTSSEIRRSEQSNKADRCGTILIAFLTRVEVLNQKMDSRAITPSSSNNR